MLRAIYRRGRSQCLSGHLLGRRRRIGYNRVSPLVATGMLAIGLLVPASAGASTTPYGSSSFASSERPSASQPSEFVAEPAIEAKAEPAALNAEAGPGPGEPLVVAPAAASSPATPDANAPIDVVLWVGSQRRTMHTTASTVDVLLRRAHIKLGPHDRVSPSVTAPLRTGSVVRVLAVRSWVTHVHEPIAARTIHRRQAGLAKGRSVVVTAGTRGMRELVVPDTEQPGRTARKTVMYSRVLRHPQPRIVATGIGRFAKFARVAERGIDSTIRLANAALQMIATAYTGSCAGCTGFAANGSRVKLGLVAVDPSVIPLGTRLFIPGYGRAVAGDTGGAIVGRRIDLGFSSNAEALAFGRRPVKVYVLR